MKVKIRVHETNRVGSESQRDVEKQNFESLKNRIKPYRNGEMSIEEFFHFYEALKLDVAYSEGYELVGVLDDRDEDTEVEYDPILFKALVNCTVHGAGDAIAQYLCHSLGTNKDSANEDFMRELHYKQKKHFLNRVRQADIAFRKQATIFREL